MQLEASLVRRFWQKVDRRGDDECWPWTGAKRSAGYGLLVAGGRRRAASRIAWCIANDAEWPEGLIACHHCDNPPCVNPAHIFAGTALDNMRDSIAKGRSKSRGWSNLPRPYCRNGHPFTPGGYVMKRGHRCCLTCRAEWQAKDKLRHPPTKPAPDPAIYGHGKLCVACGHRRIDDYVPSGRPCCRRCSNRRSAERARARARARREPEKGTSA